MATTALGRLTLDLAVKLSDFTEGMSRAARETADRTREMGDSVGKFKDQLIEDLSGTPIGSAVGSLVSKLGDIGEAFSSESGIAGKAKIGALAVGAFAVSAGAALVGMALQVAEADRQLERLSKRANVTTTDMQVLTKAVKAYGLDMEGVGDILADAQEKLGEFSATGGGGLMDTLELLQKQTKMTDDEMNKFGAKLSTVDSVTAIQMVTDELEKNGATSQEVRFVTESLASGLGDIIPLWQDGGKTLEGFNKVMQENGEIRTPESIKQTRLLIEQQEILQGKFAGVSNQIVTSSLPAMDSLITYFIESTKQGDSTANSLSGIGYIAGGISSTIIGISTVFKGLGEYIGYAAANVASFLELLKDVGTNPFGAFDAWDKFTSRKDSMKGMFRTQMMEIIDSGANGIRGSFKTPSQLIDNSKDRADLTVDNSKYQATKTANEAALEASKKATEATKENTKAVSSASKSNPSNYIKYANSGASRNEKLTSTLEQKLSFLEELGVVFKVGSGGQSSTSRGRVGSTAHNGGNAGDGKFIKDGRALNINKPEDRKLLEYIVEQAASRGINGIGAANNYMGAETFHLGIQKNAATWGKDGKGANALGWITAAHRKGLKNPVASNSFERQMYSDNKSAEADKERQREQEARDEAIRQTAMQNASNQLLNEKAKIELEASQKVAETIKIFRGEAGQDAVLKGIERDKQEQLAALDARVLKPFLTQEDVIQVNYTDRIKEANKAYGEGSVEAIKASEAALIERDKALADLRAETLRPYLSASDALKDQLDRDIKDVELKHGVGSETALKAIEYLKSKYDVENAELEYLAGEAQRQVATLSRNIGISTRQSVDQLQDSQARASMTPEEFESYSANQEWQRGRRDQQGSYEDREAEINAVDSKGDFLYEAEDRNKLLEEAHTEHLSRMALLDDEYANRTTSIAQESANKKLDMEQANVDALGSLAGVLLGQQSTAARAAFLVSKAYTVQKILLAKGESMATAYADAKGGVFAKAAAAAMAGIKSGLFADMVNQVVVPTFSGVAHGGMDYIPSESTFLLDKGERVLSPRQNKDLTSFLAQGGAGSKGGDTNITITIDNNGNANMNSDNAAEVSKQMSIQIKNIVQATLRQEKRQGGML